MRRLPAAQYAILVYGTRRNAEAAAII